MGLRMICQLFLNKPQLSAVMAQALHTFCCFLVMTAETVGRFRGKGQSLGNKEKGYAFRILKPTVVRCYQMEQ